MTITAYTKTQSDNSFLKHVGPSNGTDDTAHINALLAGGGKIVGQPGQTYLTSAPLVIPSSTTLDMTGCTVQLKTGSNCNMLNNTAVAAVVRVLNAVMTSGSAVLTDSTGSFTAGMVGKAVTVQGAGAAGAPLTTTVASYQSATQITLSATAGTSVTGQYAAVGPRDSRQHREPAAAERQLRRRPLQRPLFRCHGSQYSRWHDGRRPCVVHRPRLDRRHHRLRRGHH
jgi:hypothetical protein